MMKAHASLLIVEDDSALSNTLEQLFRKRHIAVSCVNNLPSATQLIETQRFDYYLLDLNVLSESSLKLIPQIKQGNEEALIVIMTGYASIATAVEAIKLGATNYLPKPLEFSDVLNAFQDQTAQTTPEKPADDAQPFDTMSVRRLEWEHIQRTLAENNGNISETARQLKMHRRTLQRKLQKKPAK